MNRITAQEAVMLAEDAVLALTDSMFLKIEEEAKKGNRFLDTEGSLSDKVLSELEELGFTYEFFSFQNKYRITW